MPLNSTESTPGTVLARCNEWAFKTFLCSTLFIIIFSVAVIHSWPSMVKHTSILLACILPAGVVILSQISIWWDAKKIPKEALWVLLVFILGLISSLLSENIWISLKSMVLFMVSGPFIFITTMYLFESTKNQKVFLWMSSLCILCFGIFGVYEHNFSEGIFLFSENPLPAGASLLLLSASPMILLTRERSPILRLILILGLISAGISIILLAKKGPVLSLVVVVLFWVYFINRRYLKFMVVFALLAGCLLYFSESTLSKYRGFFKLDKSSNVRVEHYFFGFHVIKKKPVWGIGSKADLDRYLKDYDSKSFQKRTRGSYASNLLRFNTFENIVLAFLVELGGLFSIVYFGGIIYIFTVFFKKFRAPPQKNLAGMFAISIIIGFAIISCTFDTLKFPNLNWLFHSLLGLMMNLPQSSIETPKPD